MSALLPDNPQQLIDALLDGRATPDQIESLGQWIAADPDHADRFTRQSLLHSHTRGLLTGHAETRHATTSPTSTPARAPQQQTNNNLRFIKPVAFAAAAALLIAGVVATVIALSTTEPAEPLPPKAQPRVATLVHLSRGSAVVVNDDIGNPGNDYSSGEYAIDSGAAEFMLTSDTSVRMSGKTRLTLHSGMRASIEEGTATFNCPPQAVGYTVLLPDGSRVVDLGTRFTVRVDPAGRVAVEVLEGLVNVVANDEAKTEHAVTAGTSLVQNDGDWQPGAPATALPTDALVLHLTPGHGVERDSAGRVVRWNDRLAGDNTDAHDTRQDLPNQRPHFEAKTDRQPAALRFEAVHASGLIVDPKTTDDFNFDGSFTVAVWCRVDEFDTMWQALIAKGDSAWRLHRYQETGQVSFGTSSNSRNTSDLPSESSIDDGGWHLVVAVGEADRRGLTKRLYIDGKLESEERVGTMRENDTPVMIANNTDKPERALSGWIGEVAIYSRVLAIDEIENYYETGRPEDGPKKTRD